MGLCLLTSKHWQTGHLPSDTDVLLSTRFTLVVVVLLPGTLYEWENIDVCVSVIDIRNNRELECVEIVTKV